MNLKESITKALQCSQLLIQDLQDVNRAVSTDETPGGMATHHLTLQMIETTAKTERLLRMLAGGK